MPAEFDWGEPVGHEYKVKKSPFCFIQGGGFIRFCPKKKEA